MNYLAPLMFAIGFAIGILNNDPYVSLGFGVWFISAVIIAVGRDIQDEIKKLKP